LPRRLKIQDIKRDRTTGSRFPNIKRHTARDGTVLDSKHELKRYGELLLLQAAHSIRDLRVHPRYVLEIGGEPILLRSKGYPNGRKMTYVADFEYWDEERSKTVIEDVKMQSGHRTEVYKIKRAIMELGGYEIEEV